MSRSARNVDSAAVAREVAAFAEDARQRFEALYERLPTWEVERPQPAIVDLAERGLIRGRVLDVGCGTGENALFLAGRGFAAWGLDIALPAIGMAQAKAAARALPRSRLLVGDALRLDQLGLRFDTLIDCGLFHALTDRERELYAGSLAAAAGEQALLHLLCYSDAQPGTDGPRRISRSEIEATFVADWCPLRIARTRLDTRIHQGGAHAWCATLERRERQA